MGDGSDSVFICEEPFDARIYYAEWQREKSLMAHDRHVSNLRSPMLCNHRNNGLNYLVPRNFSKREGRI